MYILLFFVFITIAMFVSSIIKKHYFKSNEEIDAENAISFMQNYKIPKEERIAIEISTAISSNTIVRKNLRRLIAAEIKARVLESSLEPTAFPSFDEWEYEKSKSELENEKKQLEDALLNLKNEEYERQRLAQEIRGFLQIENISEEWFVKKPQLFMNHLNYQCYQQTPSYDKKTYKKLDDFGLIELRYCIQNKSNIINAYNIYKKWKGII